MNLKKKFFNIYGFLNLSLFFLILFSATSVKAQMEISGFFDVVGVNNFSTSNENPFFINQFELDVSYENQSHYSIGTAVAYNNETETMELAMAFVHYAFDDSHGKHPRREEAYDHSALQIGMFDMPFGLDYLSYASIDRPTVTQPLVIEKTIAGWNDIGIDYHLFKGNLKFDVWAVNGFDEGIGIGGNVRYKFFPFLEIGVSHSADINDFQEVNDWLSGVDFRINTDIFQIKSEFLWMKGVYEGKPDTVLNNEMHHGGYIQLLTELEEWTTFPLFLTLRFGGWQCDANDESVNDSQRRYTAALGYKLDDNLSVRMEVVTNQFDEEEAETQGYLQLVVGF